VRLSVTWSCVCLWRGRASVCDVVVRLSVTWSCVCLWRGRATALTLLVQWPSLADPAAVNKALVLSWNCCLTMSNGQTGSSHDMEKTDWGLCGQEITLSYNFVCKQNNQFTTLLFVMPWNDLDKLLQFTDVFWTITFPERHFPERHFPERHFPERHFPERHFPEKLY